MILDSSEWRIFDKGTWSGGTWIGGIWRDGTWANGTWKQGLWCNGTWINGVWENGTWWNGSWGDGVWEGGIWKGGTWGKGSWLGGQWLDGVWLGGYDRKGSYHPAGDSPDLWESEGGWEGDILNWGYARGGNQLTYFSCGLLVSDAHESYPTEAFHWESNEFAAWSIGSGSGDKQYATCYTISSFRLRIANTPWYTVKDLEMRVDNSEWRITHPRIRKAFGFVNEGTNHVRLVADPYSLLPCRLWANHPEAIPSSILYGVFWEDKIVTPSQKAYISMPLYVDFDCVIAGHFTNCLDDSVSHRCIVRVYMNWSSRASDLILGFDDNQLPLTKEDYGLATTWFDPVTKLPMTAKEWHNYVCANMHEASRFMSNTIQNNRLSNNAANTQTK